MDFRIFVLFGLLYSGHCSDFRCHCNEPTCVRTFYLCKSELGCYKLHNSKSLGSKVKRSLKYGCIEHLPEEVSFRCWSDNVFDLLKNPNKIRIVSDKVNDIVTVTSGVGRERGKNDDDRHKAVVAAGNQQQRVTGRNSTLECCFQDLCNHDFEFDENLVIKDILFGGDGNVKTYAAKNRRKTNIGTRPTMAVDSGDEADKEEVVVLMDSVNVDTQTSNFLSSRPYVCVTLVVVIFGLFSYFYYSYRRLRRTKMPRFTTFRPMLEADSGGEKRTFPGAFSAQVGTLPDVQKTPAADMYDSVIAGNLYWASAKLDEKVDTFTVLMESEDWRDAHETTGRCA